MTMAKANKEKVAWSADPNPAVQPRIRLMRSFDERHHSYQGYVLRIDGSTRRTGRRVPDCGGEGLHTRSIGFAPA